MELLREKRLDTGADSQLRGFPNLVAQREIEMIDAMAMIWPGRSSQRVLISRKHLSDRALAGGVHRDLHA